MLKPGKPQANRHQLLTLLSLLLPAHTPVQQPSLQPPPDCSCSTSRPFMVSVFLLVELVSESFSNFVRSSPGRGVRRGPPSVGVEQWGWSTSGYISISHPIASLAGNLALSVEKWRGGFPRADVPRYLPILLQLSLPATCGHLKQPLVFPGGPFPTSFASLLVTVTVDVSMSAPASHGCHLDIQDQPMWGQLGP